MSYGVRKERTTNGGDGAAEVGKHLYLFDSFVIHPPPNWITLKGRVRPTPILQMGEIAARIYKEEVSLRGKRLREYPFNKERTARVSRKF